ncbi:hypothetical protein KKG81_10765 [bacterium]|nr:hypothetical protein [bacterium]
MGWKKNTIIASITLILIGVISWAFYNLIYTGSADAIKILCNNIPFLSQGFCESEYTQNILVLLVGISLILILGISGKSIWKKILKG